MDLRDIIVVSVVLFLAVMALRQPWLGVMNWTWLSIMNPHRYTWGFAYNAPLAAIAAASTLLGLLLTKDKRSPFQGAPVNWFFAFALWVTISWLAGTDPAGDYGQWDKVMKIYLMTFVALSLLHTKQHIQAFAWVTIGSIALLGAKGGVFTVSTGGAHRVWGPAGSFIEGNNEFALACIVTVPMLYFLQQQVKSRWAKYALTITMLLTLASAVGSYSRGAFLAIFAMGLVFWWRSKNKGVIAVAAVFVLLAALPVMPDSWWERMETIKTYKEDKSAMGRIEAWTVAIRLAMDRPTGAGMRYSRQQYFNLYGPPGSQARAAHSIYFQVLGNHGFIGLFIYLMLWFSTFRMAGRLRRNAKDIPEARWVSELGAMVQVSLVAFAVGGAFLSLSYFDLPYNLMVMIVLANKWFERRAWESEPDTPVWDIGIFSRRSVRGFTGPQKQS